MKEFEKLKIIFYTDLYINPRKLKLDYCGPNTMYMCCISKKVTRIHILDDCGPTMKK